MEGCAAALRRRREGGMQSQLCVVARKPRRGDAGTQHALEHSQRGWTAPPRGGSASRVSIRLSALDTDPDTGCADTGCADKGAHLVRDLRVRPEGQQRLDGPHGPPQHRRVQRGRPSVPLKAGRQQEAEWSGVNSLRGRWRDGFATHNARNI